MGPILAVNDIHATRHPPGKCTDSYWDDLLALLYQTVDVAQQHDASAVVWAGDVFHHKAPSRTDHGLVLELVELVRAYPCPVYAVPGNHDLRYDRIESLPSQPLGVLFGAGLRKLDGWAGDNLPLYGVPWQQRWSEQVIADRLASFREHLFGQALVVTHAPIYPPGREPGYAGAEFTPAAWWARAIDDGPFEHGLLYGHIHEPHGVFAADDSGLRFCNYGALSRGSLDEYNREREVGCALWSPGTGFRFVPLKSRPASEVFRLEEHDRERAAQVSLADFVAGVRRTTLAVLSLETVIAAVRAQVGAGPVADLAEELLTAQQGGTR